jgi:probable HAF family extracellular repeat protein
MEAFRWTADEGMVGLGDLLGGRFWSNAGGVSADGSVIVGSSISDTGYTAFRWTETTGMIALRESGYSEASRTTQDGSVVVGLASFGGGITAFRWTRETGMKSIGDLPGGRVYGVANDVVDGGNVIAGWSNSANGDEAFRWTEESGIVGLGDFSGGSFRSTGARLTADGSIAVGQGTTENGMEPFLWTEEQGMQSLQQILIGLGVDLSGWQLTRGTGISADGSVVIGAGINPDGNQEAFAAVLKTDPGEPPKVVCTVDPASLWPPNHDNVDVDVFIYGEDDISEVTDLEIEKVLVSSNEPDNGLGDGDTEGDVDGGDGFTAPVEIPVEAFQFDEDLGVWIGKVSLRAERSGEGGRVYTIQAFVKDEAGNVGSNEDEPCEVTVAHDQRSGYGKAKVKNK